MRNISVLLLLISMAWAGQAPIPPAPPVTAGQPTVAEMTLFGWVNLYRLNSREADYFFDNILREQLEKKTPVISGLMLNSWLNAKRKPEGVISPVVVNPALMDAARAILASKVKWVQAKGVPHADAFRAAGYTPENPALVLIGANAPSLKVAWLQAVTNVVTTKQQKNGNGFIDIPIFAGRTAITAEWREVGLAVDESGGKSSLVVVLAIGSATRYIGGAVYVDSNHNGTCDVGEHKAGAKITVGDQSTLSGPAGAWWLALKQTDPVDVVFTLDGLVGTRKLEGGSVNAIIDWRVPNAADLANAKKLIADAEKDATAKEEEKRRKALSILLAGTRMAILDDEHQRKVDALIQPIREDYDELLRKTLAAMGEDPAGFKKRMNDIKLPWKGCLVAWFKEAELLYTLRAGVNEMQSAVAAKRAAGVPPLAAQLAKAIASSGDPALQEQFILQKTNLENLPPPPSEAPKPAKK